MAKKKADMNVHDLSVKTAKFYEYNQNNSGGSFIVDKNLCHRLMIEADEQHLADRIAISLGVYFNGCYEGLDCDCCGDRWYPGHEISFPYQMGCFSEEEANAISKKYKGKIVPTKYKPYRDKKFDVVFYDVLDYSQYMSDEYGWTKPEMRIFYKKDYTKPVEVFIKGKRSRYASKS